jgi:SAM-dependent methyltransferase
MAAEGQGDGRVACCADAARSWIGVYSRGLALALDRFGGRGEARGSTMGWGSRVDRGKETGQETRVGDYFGTRYSFDKGRRAVWRAIAEVLHPEISPSASVLDLGAGYCDFINQIRASRKIALDSDPRARQYCDAGVEFLHSNAAAIPLPDATVDAVFASNLLEHFDGAELDKVASEILRVLRPGGKLILIQPNYYYCYREYWDDYTHKKAFTHASLGDFLRSHGFRICRSVPRFLPFSFKSRLPRSYLLTKLYLGLPWHFGAKQMLVIAEKGS